MKKGPIVIFSKSYCPFSIAAKKLLLETYSIDPKPFVVEIDLHPHGPELQKHISSVSGRRTVPNIHIQGVSRGGADDFMDLEEEGTLVSKIKQWINAGKAKTGFKSITIKKNTNAQ